MDLLFNGPQGLSSSREHYFRSVPVQILFCFLNSNLPSFNFIGLFWKKNHKFYSFPPHGTLSMLRVSLSGCGWYALDHSDSSFCAHGFVHSLPTCGWWRTCICCVELNLDWPPGGGPLRFDFYLLSFFQYDLVALPREMTLENKGVCHIFF